MRIHGLIKLTLLDYPGLIGCTIFSGGCNFRCPFCHNASLVLNPDSEVLIKEEDVLSFLKSRIGRIDGVCFTGGEPLIEPGLLEFMWQVKTMCMKIKLDTNGFLFDKLKDAVNSGIIDYVAMDIKNSPSKYGMTVGIENLNFEPIKNSVEFLKNSGIDYEFRTTIVDEFHEPKDFVEIAKLIKGCKHYYLQCFKDSGDIISSGLHAPSKEKIEKICEVLRENGIEPILRNFD